MIGHSDRPQVILGFSGGIDSTSAAKILSDGGMSVTALTLDTTADELMLRQAAEAAGTLGIRHRIIDIRYDFKRTIVDYFLDSYTSGRTPAPCTLCNTAIKWRYLLEAADTLGAEYIATGHYFNIKEYNGRRYVSRADDRAKDQSYYLWGLSQRILSKALTPMGHIIKHEIKRHYANKSESMGLCFLNGMSCRDFISLHRPQSVQHGDITDAGGRIIGRHDGTSFYTVGQRRGINIDDTSLYITAIDNDNNRLIVGNKQHLYHSTLEVADCNIVDEDELLSSSDIKVMIRGIGRNPEGYARRAVRTTAGYCITLDDAAYAPAVGQPVVFYRGDRVIGGGILERYY